MNNSTPELVSVEQELVDLRHHLKQSFAVLEDLAQVQTQFESLAQTYQQLKAQINATEATLGDFGQLREQLDQRLQQLEMGTEARWQTLQHDVATLQTNLQEVQQAADHERQAQATLSERLAHLETTMESSWKDLRGALLEAQNETSLANRNLKTEFTEQTGHLRRNFEAQLAETVANWNQQKKALQAPIEEFEARLRSELRSVLSQGFGPQHIEKLEKLSTQMSSSKSALRAMDKKLQRLRVGLMLTTLIAAIALAVPAWLWASEQEFWPLNARTSGDRPNTEAISDPDSNPNAAQN